MAGTAALESRILLWIFRSKRLVAAEAGAIRVRRVIGHIDAHGIARFRSLNAMAIGTGAGGVAVAWQPVMVAGAAFDRFMRGMIENHIHAWRFARVELNGLIEIFQIGSLGIRLRLSSAENG